MLFALLLATAAAGTETQSESTAAATCSDGKKNQDETEIDCGGENCMPCSCWPDQAAGDNSPYVDPEKQDGTHVCETYITGGKTYGYLDVDEVTYNDGEEGKVSLSMHPITATYKDHTGKDHSATKTDNAPVYDTTRWLLKCAETAGQKTVRIRVTRPKDIQAPNSAGTEDFLNTHGGINYFQGEFLNLYRKGQWTPLQKEKEPYTYNNFGSLIPLDKFRGTLDDATTLKDPRLDIERKEYKEDEDATYLSKKDVEKTTSDYFNVFMELSEEGDFEFRYGNPNLILGRTKPDADCVGLDDDHKGSGKVPKECGTWTAVGFSASTLRVGTPWKDCTTEALKDKRDEYGAIVPAYLGHPNLKKGEFKSLVSAVRGDGDDDWSNTMETYVVLDIFSPTAGVLDCKEDDPNCNNGVVFTKNIDKWTYSSTKDGGAVYSGDDAPACRATATADGPRTCYDKCYEAGTPCPDNHNVCLASHCSIDRFGAIKKELKENKANIKVLAFVETMEANGVDPRKKEAVAADAAMYGKFTATQVDGYFFNRVDDENKAQTKDLKEVVKELKGKIVFGTGQALTDDTLLEPDVADIVVTLSADVENKKDWNPFAWYPKEPPARWGALMTNVASGKGEEVAASMFDRGYGYVGLHAGEACTGKLEDSCDHVYDEVSSNLNAFLKAIADKAPKAPATTPATTPAGGGRRLHERQLSEAPASTYTWSCDAAQFYCAPVCMRTTGFVTTVVPDSKCEGEKQSCSCSCLFDAHWDCVDGAVVCKATHTTRLVPEIVGDLVCSTRGTEKPETCIRQLTARGTYPEEQCMTQFEEAKTARLAANVAREEAAAAREAARVAAEAKAATTAAPTEKAPQLEDVVDVQSSALPAALLAFAGLFA